jgi:large subunit ribosomal protein L9
MEIILLKNVDNLGAMGRVVSVKPGYARNFLFPRGMATLADKQNKVALEKQLEKIAAIRDAELIEANSLAAKLEKVSVTITKQVGEEGKIFGSVTTTELETLLAEQGIEISKRKLTLSEEIKTVGVFGVTAKIHPEVSGQFKVWVVAGNDSNEAKDDVEASEGESNADAGEAPAEAADS